MPLPSMLELRGDSIRLDVPRAGLLSHAQPALAVAQHLLHAMSHELRTPLQAIIGYAELLELGAHGPVTHDQRTDLDRIKKAGHYVVKLVNDVLAVARLENAHVPLLSAPVRIPPIVTEAAELCALHAAAKAISLRVLACDTDVTAAADPQRVQQIVLNLLTNALKFTARGGSVTVTCEIVKALVRIDVRDTGCGIAPANLERVFEPFVQIDAHLTPETDQGAGLGLSISRDLALAMGGDLTLASTVGVGSVFSLTLPSARGLWPGEWTPERHAHHAATWQRHGSPRPLESTIDRAVQVDA